MADGKKRKEKILLVFRSEILVNRKRSGETTTTGGFPAISGATPLLFILSAPGPLASGGEWFRWPLRAVLIYDDFSPAACDRNALSAL